MPFLGFAIAEFRLVITEESLLPPAAATVPPFAAAVAIAFGAFRVIEVRLPNALANIRFDILDPFFSKD
jgi:hypothetical protein